MFSLFLSLSLSRKMHVSSNRWANEHGQSLDLKQQNPRLWNLPVNFHYRYCFQLEFGYGYCTESQFRNNNFPKMFNFSISKKLRITIATNRYSATHNQLSFSLLRCKDSLNGWKVGRIHNNGVSSLSFDVKCNSSDLMVIWVDDGLVKGWRWAGNGRTNIAGLGNWTFCDNESFHLPIK